MSYQETDKKELRRNRQCGLGWHYECSDPFGESCECECHPWILRNAFSEITDEDVEIATEAIGERLTLAALPGRGVLHEAARAALQAVADARRPFPEGPS